MNSEKRGSEKMLQMEDDLCALTAEELDQVAGGAAYPGILAIKDYFPVGILPPDIWNEKLEIDILKRPGNVKEQITVPGWLT